MNLLPCGRPQARPPGSARSNEKVTSSKPCVLVHSSGSAGMATSNSSEHASMAFNDDVPLSDRTGEPFQELVKSLGGQRAKAMLGMCP